MRKSKSITSFWARSVEVLSACVAALVICAAIPARAEIVDRIVARVNNDIITLSYIRDKMRFLEQAGYFGAQSSLTETEKLEGVLEGVIEEKLQIQEAKRYQLKVGEDIVGNAIDEIKTRNGFNDETLAKMLEAEHTTLEQYKDKIREQILMSKVSSHELRSRIKVSEKDMRRYYKEHQKDFMTVDRVHPRHILFFYDEGVTADQKKMKMQKAKSVLALLQGGANFAEIAQKHSEDVTANNGGDLGMIERGKMIAAFEDAVFKLKAGEMSGIVETPYGLHIIKVEELFPARNKTFEEVKDEIEQILFQSKREKEFKAWIKELRDAAFVSVTLTPDYEKKRKSRLQQGETLAPTQTAMADVGDDFFESDSSRSVKKSVKPGKSASSGNGKESSKDAKPGLSKSEFGDMKKKLVAIKELRDQNKITEAEYQKRKKELLKEL